MIPKEKAQEIFNAMHKIYDMSNYPDFTIDENDNQKNDELWKNNNELYTKIYKQFAKESSLIAVNELIADEHLEVGDNPYWINVKQEIEKL